MHGADTLARPPAKSDPPRDQLDRDYVAGCLAAGIEPELARVREFSEVLSIPGIIFGQLDRGRRIQGASILDVIKEAVDYASSECPDFVARKSLVTSKVIFFVLNVRDGQQMLHRAAAVLIEAGMTHADLRMLWPRQLKESPLRLAKKHLKLMRKGGAL
jgi:hypothetical protein